MKNRLKEIRKEQKISPYEVARKLDISYNTLHQYETSQREPKLEMWQKLARFFRVPVSYLQGLTIGKKDILRCLNEDYLLSLSKNDPFHNESEISDFLDLLRIKKPENIFSKKELSIFTSQVEEYWNKHFGFLFLCDSIIALAFTTHKNEDISFQVDSAIKEVNYMLTATEISKAFDKRVEKFLVKFGQNRKSLMRFSTKQSITNVLSILGSNIMSFVSEIDNLPENSPKQYEPSIAQHRLNDFINKRKKELVKQQKGHIVNYIPYD